jgi:type III secretion protein V
LRPGVRSLPEHGYSIRLLEVAMASGTVVPGHVLAPGTPEQLAERGFRGGTAGVSPEGGAGTWLPESERERAKAAGLPTSPPEETVIRHVAHLMRRYGHELMGIQETQALLEALEKSHPALVREVVPKLISPVVLTDVLKRLAEEGVSLRSMREILGALAEWAPLERDPVALTEHVRVALRRQMVAKYLGPSGALVVYLLDPMIEETVRESIQRTATGSYLALEPAISRDIVQAVGRTIAGASGVPVILTSAEIRRYVRRLLEAEFPTVAVLSFQEMSAETKLQPLGRIKVA